MTRILSILLAVAGLASAQAPDLIVDDLSVDGRFRGEVNQVLAGEFDLARLTIVTQTLSQPITDFRWVHLIAGEDDINGLGLGVISVPLAEIPVATPTPQFVLYGSSLVDTASTDSAHSTEPLLEDIGHASTPASIALGEAGEALYGATRVASDSNIYSVDRVTGAAMLLGGSTFWSAFIENISLGGVDGILLRNSVFNWGRGKYLPSQHYDWGADASAG